MAAATWECREWFAVDLRVFEAGRKKLSTDRAAACHQKSAMSVWRKSPSAGRLSVRPAAGLYLSVSVCVCLTTGHVIHATKLRRPWCDDWLEIGYWSIRHCSHCAAETYFVNRTDVRPAGRPAGLPSAWVCSTTLLSIYVVPPSSISVIAIMSSSSSSSTNRSDALWLTAVLLSNGFTAHNDLPLRQQCSYNKTCLSAGN